MVLITIIMPAYNVDQYITDSINSVLSQSIEDWELIVVNDGSTDNTQKLIEQFVEKESRIKLINQENAGVSSARNKGLSLATGKYISFLDSDDIYDKDYLKLMAQPLIEDKADMVFCKFQEINGSQVLQESPREVNELYLNNFIAHLLNVKKPMHSMGIMYRLSIIRKHSVCFNESYSYGEDLEFVLLMSYYSRVNFLPKYLYRYIYRSGSLSRQVIPYKDLLGELDGLHSLHKIIDSSDKGDVMYYREYLEKRMQGTLNNIRRQLWADLKNQKYDQVLDVLNSYKQRYGKPFDVRYKGLKKLTMFFKIKVIQSQNKKLWQKLFK